MFLTNFLNQIFEFIYRDIILYFINISINNFLTYFIAKFLFIDIIYLYYRYHSQLFAIPVNVFKLLVYFKGWTFFHQCEILDWFWNIKVKRWIILYLFLVSTKPFSQKCFCFFFPFLNVLFRFYSIIYLKMYKLP